MGDLSLVVKHCLFEVEHHIPKGLHIFIVDSQAKGVDKFQRLGVLLAKAILSLLSFLSKHQ